MNIESNRYQKYKSTQIEWLGEVPDHWDIFLLKRFTKIFNGSTPSTSDKENWNGKITWYTPDDLGSNRGKTIFTSQRYISKKGLKSCGASLVPSNSIIISTRAPIGHIAITEIEATTNQGCKSIVLNRDRVITDFVYYYLHSNKNILKSLGSGSTFTELSTNKLKSFHLLVPPFPEQKAIATFLDHQTTRIDQLIKKKKRILELLDEQRQAIITRAVTKGINPYAKMKDSEIEWLGEVPEHWEVEKLKYFAQLNNREIEVDEDVEIQKVALENIESKTGHLLFNDDDKSFQGKGNPFTPGDVLFNKLRPYLAKVVCADFHGLAVGELLVLTPDSEILDSRYLFYRMLSEQFIKIVNNSTYGAKMPRANWEFIGNLKIGIPPIQEQKEIVESLDKEIKQFEHLKSKIQNAIEKLEEYRSSLITQAVIGKIDVSRKQTREKITGKRANIYFQRTVLAVRILDELHSEPTMGRRKLQRILYLLEKHIEGIRLGGKYVKAAAGPFDNKLMRSVEKQLKDRDWFIRSRRKNGYGYLYTPGDNKDGYLKYYPRYWGDAESKIADFLDLVRTEKTDLLSSAATLHACWNDFMIKGHEIKGIELIRESKFNWHKEKEEIPIEDWKEALNWLWYNNIRPSGSGDLTKEL